MINSSKSSGSIAATAAASVTALPGKLTSVILIGDGTNAATVTVYDNSAGAASGTVLAVIAVDAGLVYESFVPAFPIDALQGISVAVVGTGSSAVVHYQAG